MEVVRAENYSLRVEVVVALRDRVAHLEAEARRDSTNSSVGADGLGPIVLDPHGGVLDGSGARAVEEVPPSSASAI